MGPLLGAAFVELATEFDVPLSTFISGVQGGLLVSIAFGSLICNTLAVKYGKRPIYLITTFGLVFGQLLRRILLQWLLPELFRDFVWDHSRLSCRLRSLMFGESYISCSSVLNLIISKVCT